MHIWKVDHKYTLLYSRFLPYLILPGHRHATCVKLAVEIIINLIKDHSFNRRELIDVQDVCAVNGSRLVERGKSDEKIIQMNITGLFSGEKHTHVGNKGWRHPSCLKSRKVDVLKERMTFDGIYSLPELAAQSLLWVFSQKLKCKAIWKMYSIPFKWKMWPNQSCR